MKGSVSPKGEVSLKTKTSYLAFGVLSGMVKVRGAFDKPFSINKRLNGRPELGK